MLFDAQVPVVCPSANNTPAATTVVSLVTVPVWTEYAARVPTTVVTESEIPVCIAEPVIKPCAVDAESELPV